MCKRGNGGGDGRGWRGGGTKGEGVMEAEGEGTRWEMKEERKESGIVQDRSHEPPATKPKATQKADQLSYHTHDRNAPTTISPYQTIFSQKRISEAPAKTAEKERRSNKNIDY